MIDRNDPDSQKFLCDRPSVRYIIIYLLLGRSSLTLGWRDLTMKDDGRRQISISAQKESELENDEIRGNCLLRLFNFADRSDCSKINSSCTAK